VSATHLHKTLERELWIFGEGYDMMSSERGLTQVLRTHLKLEGLPDNEVLPVKRWNGKTEPVDLHLAVRAQQHDRARHLIVELKLPISRSAARNWIRLRTTRTSSWGIHVS
jgi:hypothetical protein